MINSQQEMAICGNDETHACMHLSYECNHTIVGGHHWKPSRLHVVTNSIMCMSKINAIQTL